MGTYILVIILSNSNGKATTTVEFKNEQNCTTAQKTLLRNYSGGLYAYCFKK